MSVPRRERGSQRAFSTVTSHLTACTRRSSWCGTKTVSCCDLVPLSGTPSRGERGIDRQTRVKHVHGAQVPDCAIEIADQVVDIEVPGVGHLRHATKRLFADGERTRPTRWSRHGRAREQGDGQDTPGGEPPEGAMSAKAHPCGEAWVRQLMQSPSNAARNSDCALRLLKGPPPQGPLLAARLQAVPIRTCACRTSVCFRRTHGTQVNRRLGRRLVLRCFDWTVARRKQYFGQSQRQRHRQQCGCGVDVHQGAEMDVKNFYQDRSQPITSPHKKIPHGHENGESQRLCPPVSPVPRGA
jgi:hypothetical protein